MSDSLPLVLSYVMLAISAAAYGQSAVFGLFMAILLLTAAAVGLLSEETKGRSLEDIAPAA